MYITKWSKLTTFLENLVPAGFPPSPSLHPPPPPSPLLKVLILAQQLVNSQHYVSSFHVTYMILNMQKPCLTLTQQELDH